MMQKLIRRSAGMYLPLISGLSESRRWFFPICIKEEGRRFIDCQECILYVTAQDFSGCLMLVADQKEKAERIRPYSHFL